MTGLVAFSSSVAGGGIAPMALGAGLVLAGVAVLGSWPGARLLGVVAGIGYAGLIGLVATAPQRGLATASPGVDHPLDAPLVALIVMLVAAGSLVAIGRSGGPSGSRPPPNDGV